MRFSGRGVLLVHPGLSRFGALLQLIFCCVSCGVHISRCLHCRPWTLATRAPRLSPFVGRRRAMIYLWLRRHRCASFSSHHQTNPVVCRSLSWWWKLSPSDLFHSSSADDDLPTQYITTAVLYFLTSAFLKLAIYYKKMSQQSYSFRFEVALQQNVYRRWRSRSALWHALTAIKK